MSVKWKMIRNMCWLRKVLTLHFISYYWVVIIQVHCVFTSCSGSIVHRLPLHLNSSEPVSFYAYKMETFRLVKCYKLTTGLIFYITLHHFCKYDSNVYSFMEMICDLSSVFRAEIWLWSCSLTSCWSSSSLWSFFLLFSSLSISSSASSSCLFSTFSLRVNFKGGVKRAGHF